MGEVFGKGLGGLYFSICNCIDWWIHAGASFLRQDKRAVWSAKALPWPNLILFCLRFAVCSLRFSFS
jgi:hypothetical protein